MLDTLPDTCAADFIRRLSRLQFDESDGFLSLSQASHILAGVAQALEMDDDELAFELANHWQSRRLGSKRLTVTASAPFVHAAEFVCGIVGHRADRSMLLSSFAASSGTELTDPC